MTDRSTSGVVLMVIGPNSFLPLPASSKRQTCGSFSIPESELVSADLGVRAESLPAVTLWEERLQREVSLIFCEDNATCVRVIEAGRNPTMRHIGRTHRGELAFPHERFVLGQMVMQRTITNNMSAGMPTNGARQFG